MPTSSCGLDYGNTMVCRLRRRSILTQASDKFFVLMRNLAGRDYGGRMIVSDVLATAATAMKTECPAMRSDPS